MKIFVDTNVLLDIALDRDGAAAALTIFKAAKYGVFDGVIADITIANIDYIASKIDADIRAYLSAIEEAFEIVGADNSIIRKAIELENKDIEDNIQYLLALKSGCELIVTNDKSFYRGDIKVVTSKELASLYH